MVRSSLQKRIASALLLTTIAVQLQASGALAVLQSTPVFSPLLGIQSAEAQTGGNFYVENADPKYGKTWIVSITCRTASGQNVTYNQGGSAHTLAALVRAGITAKNLGLTMPQEAVVRSDGGTGAGFNWDDNSGTPHMPTVTAVCQILGNLSDTYVSSTCRDNERSGIYPNGKCNFHSPGDNNMHRFTGAIAPPVACADGVDNDGDGLRDFPQDPGCVNAQDNDETNAAQCQDGIDNDNDGAADFPNDFSCSSPSDNDETLPRSACQDGQDNDGDGKTDFPQDPGCVSNQDNDEFNQPAAQCQDGVDNDGDGKTDFPQDPGCVSATDNDEFNNALPQCSDGVDNDGDGKIDWNGAQTFASTQVTVAPNAGILRTINVTPGQTFSISGITGTFTYWSGQNPFLPCNEVYASGSVPGHSYNPPAMGNFLVTFVNQFGVTVSSFPMPNLQTPITVPAGATQARITFPDEAGKHGDNVGSCSFTVNQSTGTSPADPGCTGPGDNDETDALPQCQDGVDNDGDGATDFPNDFSCSSPTDTDETNPKAACQDGADNDGDGLVDFPQDPGCASKQDNDEFHQVQCPAARTTANFEGRQGPWEDVAPNGDATPPTFVGGVQAGGTVKVVSANGTYSARLYHGQDQLPLACDKGTLSFTNNANQTISKVRLDSAFGGVTVPNGATRAYVSHDEPGSYNYFDNSGNRDHRAPCVVTFDITPNSCQAPQCSDGLDNDGDGLVDFPNDPGCVNGQDNDESPRNVGALDVEKTLQGQIVPGQNAVYVVTVRNTGTVAAQNVNVYDYFLDDQDLKHVPFTFVSSQGVTCSYQSGAQQVACPVGTIQPGSTVTISLTFSVPSTQACSTQIRNRVDAWINGQQVGADVDDVTSNVTCNAQCQDGVDNDGDGAADFPNDFSCSSPTDTDETNPKAACQDGFDNDGDGKVDFPQDPGCASKQDNDEFNQHITACADQQDNDGDGAVDYPADIGCTSEFDDDEFNSTLVTCPAGQTAQYASYKLTDYFPNRNAQFRGETFDTKSVSVPVRQGERFFLTSYPHTGTPQIHYTDDEIFLNTGLPGVTLTVDYHRGTQCVAESKNVPLEITGLFQGPLNPNLQTLTLNATFKDVCGAYVSHTPYYVQAARCVPNTQCADGVDNDGDGLTDFPADPGCANAQDNDEFNQAQTVDLQIQKTGPASVTRGQTILYTIQVRNNGSIQATNLVVTDPVPAGLVYNDAQSHSTCSLQGANVVCTHPALNAGQSGTFTIAFDAPVIQNCTQSVSVVNSASVTSAQQDSNQSNNTATTLNAPTQVNCPQPTPQCRDGIDNDGDGRIDLQDPACSGPDDNNEGDDPQCADRVDNDQDGLVDFPFDPGCANLADNDEFNQASTVDLSVQKFGPASVTRGQTIFYTIQIGNSGTAQATNVVITDQVPTGLVYNDALSYGPCSLVNNQVVCNQATLAPNQFGSFLIAFDTPAVQNCQVANVVNTVTISGAQQDSNQSNNTASTQASPTRVDCPQVAQCQDGVDNDGDGAADFPNDFSCANPTDNDETNPKAACQDGLDNDQDGKVDFPQDPGCASNQDNDEFNQPTPQCRDGIDNDGDGRIDLLDPACSGPDDNNEGDDPACSDRVDNDQDGLVDFPFDPGCANPQDTDEFNQVQTVDLSITKTGPATIVRGQTLFYTIQIGNSGTAQATNVVITDQVPAGLTYNDSLSYGPCALQGANVVCTQANVAPGQFGSFILAFDVPAVQNCSAVTVTNTASIRADQTDANQSNNASTSGATSVTCPVTPTQCNDFNDNDFDGRIDFPADPGCSSPQDNNEGDEPACQDGRDNDGDGLVDFPNDPGCANPQDTDESNQPATQCRDGIDNDGDGRIDTNDAGCANGDDTNEGDGPADLSVTLSGPSTVTGGGTASYTATVVNNGPDSATQPFSVRVSVPAGLTYNAGQSSQNCSLQGSFVACTGITLALFQQTSRTVVFNVPNGTTISSSFNLLNALLGVGSAHAQSAGVCNTTIQVTGTVTPVQPDPNQGNNQSTVSTFVSCQAANQCSDGIDNDGDGRIDFPADPGCSSGTDNNEGDDPVQFGCIEITKETYDPHGNRLPIDAQFTFILDATRVAYNNAQGRARFEQVTPGQHAVAEIIPSGWTQLSVSPVNGILNVTAGANCAQVTFRNRQVFVANAQCADGYDNDGDGKTDYPMDPGCSSATDNDEFNTAFQPQCRDGADNDGDGKIDYPADPGCASADDNNELDGQPLVQQQQQPVVQQQQPVVQQQQPAATVACNDGVDNDGDGQVDLQDSGCSGSSDTDEFNFRAARCSDNLDNDGDGLKDFPQDPGCTTAHDDNEWNNRLIIDRWREWWNWNW